MIFFFLPSNNEHQVLSLFISSQIKTCPHDISSKSLWSVFFSHFLPLVLFAVLPVLLARTIFDVTYLGILGMTFKHTFYFPAKNIFQIDFLFF